MAGRSHAQKDFFLHKFEISAQHHCANITGQFHHFATCAMSAICLLFLAILLVLTSIGNAATGATVQLNANTSVFTSIKSVVFDSLQREVIIEMQPRRRCERPTFIVRLSGTALYHLVLERHDYQPLQGRKYLQFIAQRSSIYHFTYPPIQDEGIYFLEILVLYCARFEPNDYGRMCIEETSQRRNVVNLPFSIHLKPDVTLAQPLPRWVLPKESENEVALLPTRYQHQCDNGECEVVLPKEQQLWQHRLYNWVDQPNWHDVYNHSAPVRVCMVGDSHAREQTFHGKQLPGVRGRVQIEHISTHFPFEFRMEQVLENKCDYAVICYGQWPTADNGGEMPYSSDRFKKEMVEIGRQIDAQRKVSKIRFFFNSVNYNGLGILTTSCPPIDHRTVAVIDMLNEAMATVAKRFAVGYIDLNPILGPLWDSAQDYAHPTGKVMFAQMQQMLYHIFSVADPQPLSPYLVRFSDSQSVYLIESGYHARAFPNGHTFMAMGYDFDKVKVEPAAMRNEYEFGADLAPM